MLLAVWDCAPSYPVKSPALTEIPHHDRHRIHPSRSTHSARPAVPVQILRARRAGSPLGTRVGEARLRRGRLPWHPSPQRGPARLCDPAPPTQCDRHAAHGPCVQPDHHGQPDPLPPHARCQHGLGAGHRPCWHRHTNRCGTPVARPAGQPPRPGSRSLRQEGVGVEREVGQHHHHPNAPHGRHRGLEPRILHDGPQAVQNRDRDFCAAVRARPDLPRQTFGELGPGTTKRSVGSGGGKRRAQ